MQQTASRPICKNADEILAFLSERQFVRPHRPLGEVLADLTKSLGACEVAVNRSVSWLGLSKQSAIGRLRRTEVTQLARSIHRFWRAALAQTA